MGRKKLYNTEEEKTEARRRNRMNWYDRNRKTILKAYKKRKSTLLTSGLPGRPSTASPQLVAQPSEPSNIGRNGENTPEYRSAEQQVNRCIKRLRSNTTIRDPDTEESITAPHRLLGRVHQQKQLLCDFMETSVDMFCIRVAEEINATPTDLQLQTITCYLEKIASFIDGARPHIRALYHQHGTISEWRQVRDVQNEMSMAMQFLDEIHHHVDSGDLAEAFSLNLLSFQ